MWPLVSAVLAFGVLLAGFLALIAGVVVGRAAMKMVAMARATRGWPNSAGRVVRSEVRGGRAVIRYEYHADNEEYEGSDVVAGDWPYQSPRTASRLIGRYPVGKQMTVYYDPRQPRFAVLEPGISFGAMYLPVVACMLLLLAGVLMAWSACRLFLRS